MMKIKLLNILNLITCILLLALPYYLFAGKLFIGGDDTRLFYSYPFLFLKNVTFFTWYNVSSIGISGSNQYLLPFLSIWSVFDILINNKIILSYLAFSLPLIIGFIYFKKFVNELFNLRNIYGFELFLGSLFYILSPIVIFDQLFIFLTTVWLLGVVPAVGYYYLKYLKSSNFLYVYISMLTCFIFSFALYSIPWIFGFMIPLMLGSLVLVLLNKRKEILFVVKRTIIFLLFVFLSQSFWIFGFIAQYLIHNTNSFSDKVLSKDVLDTFSPTVLATSRDYIIYPLLNLFHRQIAFDFGWKLANDFINLYDKTLLLDFIFITVITIGLLYYKKYLDKKDRGTYLFILASFLLSLYFFTVNIGPLKNLFLLFGKIPGFVMFRNFYDKFAPGYIFIYSILISISLVLVKKKYPSKFFLINCFIFFVIILNFSAVKSTVNSPLWSTQNIYKTAIIPNEYLDFMDEIKNKVSSTNTILSIPFGTSVYTVIKDANSNNSYVGVSPVKIFSGDNDLSGDMSFSFTKEVSMMDEIFIDRKYNELNNILFAHNVNYVMVTKNIPTQVLKSYVFNHDALIKQDAEFLQAITDKKILTSKNGSYDLYATKKRNTLLESQNLYFQKINTVKYILYIKNIKSPQELKFNDSFHNDWKLYLQTKPNLSFCKSTIVTIATTTECKSVFSFFDPSEISYILTKPVFDSTHFLTDGVSNNWIVDPTYIKNNFDNSYYSVNKDKSINIKLVLYFRQQLYPYFGLIITFISFLLATVYLIFIVFRKNEKNK